jgi:hypothetical protein
MTLGLFRGGRLHTDLAHCATPFLSGQRCLRWEAFRDTPLLSEARYGIEVALSLHAAWRRLSVRSVTLRGVTHVTQTEKHGLVRGYLSYLRMYAEIILHIARLGFEVTSRLMRLLTQSARIGRGN